MSGVLVITFFVAVGSVVDVILTRGPACISRRFDAWIDGIAGGPPRLDLVAPSNVRKVKR
jgi:hypothetical protein